MLSWGRRSRRHEKWQALARKLWPKSWELQGGLSANVRWAVPDQDKLALLPVLLGLTLEELLHGAFRGKAYAVPQNARATAVDLDAELVARARGAGIDVATALDAHLRELVGKAHTARWLEENRDALADANAFLARHGLWSDGKRQF